MRKAIIGIVAAAIAFNGCAANMSQQEKATAAAIGGLAVGAALVIIPREIHKSRIEKMMRGFEGEHYSEVVAEFGLPPIVMDCCDGGKIFTYTGSRTRSYTTPTRISGTVTEYPYSRLSGFKATVSGGQTYYYSTSYHRTFWIGADGHVFDTEWKGW